ncbi:MAG: hypothetical protein KA801_10520 [Syntrophorhabdaceae bacterium]|nr:hypothetical protein [Syntrophorhabdaceae bacterium]
MNRNEITQTFVARQSENFEIVLPRAKIEEAVRRLAEATSAPRFHDAMELVWFKFDPNGDNELRASVSMLLTLYRCTLDGNVRPPLDLEELYARTYNKVDMDCGCSPAGPTP